MGRTVRAIRWYSKKTDLMIGKEEIKNFDLECFKKIFNHTDKNDPYIYGGSYEIKENHVPFVQPYIKSVINLDRYNYSFCTYEKDEPDAE